jgi:hypothetical protein
MSNLPTTDVTTGIHKHNADGNANTVLPSELNAWIADTINNTLDPNAITSPTPNSNEPGSTTSAMDTPTPTPHNAGNGTTGVSATSATPSSLSFGTHFSDGGLDDCILMSELRDSPTVHSLIPVVPRTLLSTLETLLSGHQTGNASDNANQQDNVLALLGTLFQQASTVKTPVITSPKPPSPLDDLENLAGIILDDENTEINMNKDPLVTLKHRFPRLDANLRDTLETLGREMQESTLEVEKRKKSYANFVVPFGAEPDTAKYIMIKNDLKIPDAYKDDPEYNQAKADLDNEIRKYKIKGSGCYKRDAQAGINCAVRARIKCFIKLVTPLARHVVKSILPRQPNDSHGPLEHSS